MARGSLFVTYKPTDETRIPDILTEGTALLMDLRRRGVVDAVGQRLRVRRQGGYSGLDVWLLLVLFFSAGATRGVRGFWDVLRPVAGRVAAVAGRRRLPSSASLSRGLEAVESDELRSQARWLLTCGECDDVLGDPAMRTRDACGQDWHVFDLDPTVTTLRQRALPADDDLPKGKRRAAQTGAPGHAGRKRGDIQFRRVTLQHAGSGLWLHAHLSAGNGEGVVDLERALDTLVETCQRLGHPLSRALARMDGEYGNVPWYTACRQRGVPFLTRLNRSKLYDEPEVLARLRTATWYRVPDSLSGPRRAAADLGVLTIKPGERTRRPDGGVYEPIAVRVVASVFEHDGPAKRGRALDGRQVELFAVDLSADAWPAPEAVAAYFGRAAEENRFAQEDRELGLDRIVSYHLPGQELAALVGLLLWNLRVVRGFAQEPPPPRRLLQPLRRVQVDDAIPAGWPRDPVVRDLLAELDGDTLLEKKRPGWRLDPETGELHCPEQRPLLLTSVRPEEHAPGRTGIIFRRPAGGCDDCQTRPTCFRSTRPLSPKHVEIAIPTALANRLRERLALTRTEPSEPALTPITAEPGPYAVADALFLPAAARQAFAACFVGATLRVEVELPEPAARQPLLLARDVPDRQRRRKSWAQNVDRFALPAGARVNVEVAGSDTLRRLLGEGRTPQSTPDAA